MGKYRNPLKCSRGMQFRSDSGRNYTLSIAPGEVLELPDDQVQDLVALGKLVRVEEPSPGIEVVEVVDSPVVVTGDVANPEPKKKKAKKDS